MSINPGTACSLAITALASAQGAWAQIRPATPTGPAGSTGLDCGGAFYAPVARLPGDPAANRRDGLDPA